MRAPEIFINVHHVCYSQSVPKHLYTRTSSWILLLVGSIPSLVPFHPFLLGSPPIPAWITLSCSSIRSGHVTVCGLKTPHAHVCFSMPWQCGAPASNSWLFRITPCWTCFPTWLISFISVVHYSPKLWARPLKETCLGTNLLPCQQPHRSNGNLRASVPTWQRRFQLWGLGDSALMVLAAWASTGASLPCWRRCQSWTTSTIFPFWRSSRSASRISWMRWTWQWPTVTSTLRPSNEPHVFPMSLQGLPSDLPAAGQLITMQTSTCLHSTWPSGSRQWALYPTIGSCGHNLWCAYKVDGIQFCRSSVEPFSQCLPSRSPFLLSIFLGLVDSSSHE